MPVLTLLTQNPPKSIAVLYIGPTKALINDQFFRLEELLQESEMPVFSWHGDIATNKKQKALTEMNGILQITPESLESILLNHTKEIPTIFRDLRFVIIDEVHQFMGQDRGNQILCQLERISRLTNTINPRRIGLSATLGSYKQAERWLSSGTGVRAVTPETSNNKTNIRLAVEIFNCIQSGYDYIYKNTSKRKCIVFANSRKEAEDCNLKLKELAAKNSQKDIFYIHHGSISKKERHETEKAIKDPYTPSVISATVSLELGIDIGQLDRVVQINPPFSVSSFLQRLGRSGRRNNAREMLLITTEDFSDQSFQPITELPWYLLHAIAIIQLYLEDKWIEPVKERDYPLNLLYHQTMSCLQTLTEATPAQLAQEVLTLSVFKHFSQKDFKTLLLHLLEIGHLEKTDRETLIIGLVAEKIINHYSFYAVFSDNTDFVVKDGTKEIGRINTPLQAGDTITLGGKAWQITEIDAYRKIYYVKPSMDSSFMGWTGSGQDIHEKILRKIREILFSDDVYPYLQKEAQARLKEARYIAQEFYLDSSEVIQTADNQYFWLPWSSSKEFHLLKAGLKYIFDRQQKSISIVGLSPYYLHLKSAFPFNIEPYELLEMLQGLDISAYKTIFDTFCQQSKFHQFIPGPLLEKAFLAEYLNRFEEEEEI